MPLDLSQRSKRTVRNRGCKKTSLLPQRRSPVHAHASLPRRQRSAARSSCPTSRVRMCNTRSLALQIILARVRAESAARNVAPMHTRQHILRRASAAGP
eukprot:3606537-Prymnesium_polylepis.1